MARFAMALLMAACSTSAPAPAPAPAPVKAAVRAPDGPRLVADAKGDYALDAGELADRPTDLVARDRKAWRVSELVGPSADAVVHAIGRDGSDTTLDAAAIVVRRDSGELYVSWLDGVDGTPLADRERPAARVEGVVRLAIEHPNATDENLPPASLAIVVDGNRVRALDAAAFAAQAKETLHNQRGVPSAAIDVARAFGGTIVSVDANGEHHELTPPSPGARALVYVNRRARFKLAWVDATGATIGDSQREVTQITLRTR